LTTKMLASTVQFSRYGRPSPEPTAARRNNDDDWLPYSCLTPRLVAMMLFEHPRVQWAPVVLRIVMPACIGPDRLRG
jgi:hypothetical protein